MADLPWLAVAPTSLAYSGSIGGPLLTPWMLICQIVSSAARIRAETIPERTDSERTPQVRLIAKLLMYASGLSGSNVLPMTLKDFDVVVGGVRPASVISRAASVAR